MHVFSQTQSRLVDYTKTNQLVAPSRRVSLAM